MPVSARPPFFAGPIFPLGMVDVQATPGRPDANSCHAESERARCHYRRSVQADPKVDTSVEKSREHVCHGGSWPNYSTLMYFVDFGG